MKITIVSAAYPYRGGIADFARLLYSELAKKHEVNVITFKRQYPSLLFPGKSQTESGKTVEAIPTERLIDSVNPLNWLKVGQKIRKDAPDLLIFKYWLPFFGPAFGTIARAAKKNKKIKTLAICHNVIPHEARPGDKSFTRYFLSAMDYFVLLSKKVQDDLKKFLPDAQSKVLPHPVLSNFGLPVEKEEARKHLKLKDGKLILFFGFIRDYKGLDVLLEAMALLREKLDLKLMVAGEYYSNEEKYKSLIEKLNISGSLLMFNGFIPSSEVRYYFCAADLVVLPYRSATQSGIVQIAMNFKKPVVATNVGGLEEVVLEGKTGYVVEKGDAAAIAEAIIKFYAGNKEAEFQKNIEGEVDKYSWKRFSEGVLEFMQK
ncbi:MAG: glycosyltransferase [Ignavibacteria bacterium]|jgi:glycosyltransferase involved in cell wall biosynthesis|nr:glycosyltransferase [Ignavibacteria bacterium]MCU7503345.1 glycosyltransferase [Ignavibacteria bacterium]MCU7515709.1 glycosyltransferase [Ignavibacteria bacterium]